MSLPTGPGHAGRDPADTRDEAYTRRLQTLQAVWWKRLLDVQAPYRWNLRRLHPGATLEVGCGLGRNLRALGPGSVGIDHNETSVAFARDLGFEAFTPEEFRATAYNEPGRFDSLLVAHVLEHMTLEEGRSLVGDYVDLVRSGGLLILITPQEAGYRRDPSHRTFVASEDLRELCSSLGAAVARSYSFPLPRTAGKIFFYNEFVVVGRR